jgi:hypothetical protein
MADIGFAGDDPVGRRIKLTSYDQNAPWFTIAASWATPDTLR